MTYTRKPDANPHASALGSIKTAKKAAASKLNGLKGGGAGRPKKVLIPYTPTEWTAEQTGMHCADNMDEALHKACCLAGGWYRRPITIDYRVTPENNEAYMLRPAEVAPTDGWAPCYTLSAH